MSKPLFIIFVDSMLSNKLIHLIKQGKIKEGCALLEKALKNIKCINPDVSPYVGHTLKIPTIDEHMDIFFKVSYSPYSLVCL